VIGDCWSARSAVTTTGCWRALICSLAVDQSSSTVVASLPPATIFDLFTSRDESVRYIGLGLLPCRGEDKGFFEGGLSPPSGE